MTPQDSERSVPRILIVGDEALLTLDLAQEVTNLGYEVVGTASNTDQAVQAALESKPDLLLVDIDLPGEQDGIETYAKIKEHFDVPVVYLTRYSERDVFEHAKETGPFGFLGKPVSIQELRSTLENAFYRFDVDARIKRSEEKFRILVETVPHGIGEIDPFGNITFANEPYCSLYGYSRDEMLGKSIFDLQASPAKAAELREYLKLVRVRHPDPIPWFSQERAKDGKRIEIRVDWNYSLDNHGLLERFVFVVTDITELFRREAALARSDERFRKAEELAGLGNWEWDISTGNLNWSEETFRTFGCDPRDIDPCFDLFMQSIHPDDKPLVEEAIAEALTGNRPYDLEFRILRPDGTERLLRSRGDILRDNQGRPERMLGMAMDITESRNAEKTLREREALIRSVSDNLPSGMIYQVTGQRDGRRQFTYLSKNVRDFYGCSPEEAMADAGLIYGRIHPEDRNRVFLEEEKSHETFSNFRTEVRMISPSGDVRWSYFASSPKRLEDGSTYWSGLEIDITERK